MSQIHIVDVEAKLNNASPFTIMEFALQEHSNIAISFSGAEDVALIDIASQIRPDVQVFCLDTGRLHPETYQFIERVRDHYKIAIDILSPDGETLREFVRAKGLYSFYQDDHAECCGIRKIAPLKIKLLGLDAWITGQRKDQSPGTRSNLPVVQFDTAFARPGDTLTKYNPLANWTSQQVWDYIRAYQVPYNLLHERGFVSIGCEPCTKAIGPGQHEREGRWWWEAATKKECGLHADNEKS